MIPMRSDGRTYNQSTHALIRAFWFGGSGNGHCYEVRWIDVRWVERLGKAPRGRVSRERGEEERREKSEDVPTTGIRRTLIPCHLAAQPSSFGPTKGAMSSNAYKSPQ